MNTFLTTIKMIVISLVIGAIIASAWYVIGLRAELEVSRQSEKNLQESVTEQKTVIEQIRADQNTVTALQSEIDNIIRNQEQELRELRDTLEFSADGTKRNFGRLALARPGLIQRIITRASNDAIRCVEIASGAPLTEAEQNGQFDNSECPTLILERSRD